MANADTRAKRSSVIGYTVVAYEPPRPDGEITARDRLQVGWTYPLLVDALAASIVTNPYVFTTAGAYQLKPDIATGRRGPGRIYSFTVTNVGTTMTVDIYDSDSTEVNKVLEYVSADGKVNWLWRDGLKFTAGIRMVIGGTVGRIAMEWD
jgi:hypothetical protein